MYDSIHGEEAQLELMLAKLEQRREMLEAQKRDIDNALEDLERIVGNAQNALHQIKTG